MYGSLEDAIEAFVMMAMNNVTGKTWINLFYKHEMSLWIASTLCWCNDQGSRRASIGQRTRARCRWACYYAKQKKLKRRWISVSRCLEKSQTVHCSLFGDDHTWHTRYLVEFDMQAGDLFGGIGALKIGRNWLKCKGTLNQAFACCDALNTSVYMPHIVDFFSAQHNIWTRKCCFGGQTCPEQTDSF